MLFNFDRLVDFPIFLLLVISSFTPLWLEKIPCTISISLHLLRLISWPNSCFCAREHSVGAWLKFVSCCDGVESSVESTGSTWCTLLFPYWAPVCLSITENRASKSPTIIVQLSISLFNLLVFTSYSLVSPVSSAYVYSCEIFLLNWPFYQLMMSFINASIIQYIMFCMVFALKSVLPDISTNNSGLFWLLFLRSIFSL